VTSRRILAGALLGGLLGLVHCSSDGGTAALPPGAAPPGEGPPSARDAGATADAPDGATILPDGAIVPPPPPPPVRDAAGPPPNPPPGGPLPRIVAYVNVLCGFGVGARGGECAAQPDPTVNYVKQWEDAGTSPVTHYVVSFLSFQGSEIQTDPGEIWKNGGGSTTDFALEDDLRAALASAHAHGKKILLSLGGEVGSSGFLGWRSALGSTSAMTAKLTAAAQLFETSNGFAADGFDVDIELGGVYAYGSDKYTATRDLIDAVPDAMLVAFVPQIGNGLCAAPIVGDPLPPPTVLGGQCQQPVNGDDSSWVLARLDTECRHADGTPKLDYWGIQYYNAGQAQCCGGGADAPSMIQSTVQNYVDLANGWPASGDTTDPANPWHAWAYYPGPWAAFAGIGADRLVLGKPGCQGCAGSDYLALSDMQALIAGMDGKLAKPPGGLLFWDLGRLFGGTGPQCVSGTCQPSWGTGDVRANLASLKAQLAALKTK
jgi:hypothetical protein